jgi:peptide/nickel transport system substrate-binding protein
MAADYSRGRLTPVARPAKMAPSMHPLLLATLLAADTLVVGTLADPVSLDPHRATDLVSAAIVSNVCEPLVRFRSDGTRPEAALATTWATMDARRWTFTLRDHVRFHDGSRLDADAVVANLDDLRARGLFAGRAERVGPLVVALTLDRPNAALLATLSQPFFSMQSPRELAAGSNRPVGTGPFRHVPGGHAEVRLAAAAGHWGGPTRLQHVVFRRLHDEDALVRALLAGEVDATSAVGQEQVGRLHGRPDVVVESQIGLNLAFLSIDNERPPYSDPRVRRALARAIDREGLVDGLLGGHGEPARNPLPPQLWGYTSRTRELSLDRPAARRLLAEAGFPAGFDTTLMVTGTPRPYLPAPRRLAERIRADLAEIGVRATLQDTSSWSEYVGRATRGEYDLAVLGWQADTSDPNDFLSALLASESIGSTNRSRYRSEAMDALLKQGRRGSDPGERAGVYHEAQALFQRDMPFVPLYHVSTFTAYRKVVQGLVTGATGIPRFDKAWKTR